MDKTTTLKPCPFCGSAECEIQRAPIHFFVSCPSCGAEGPWHKVEWGAVNKWNHRPTEDALAEALYAYTKPDTCGFGCAEDGLCRMCQGEAALAKARGAAS